MNSQQLKFPIIFLLFISCLSANSQVTINGHITDQETGESIMFATIALIKDGFHISGVESDFDGYSFNL